MSAINDYLEKHPELQQRDNQQEVNRLVDDTWIFRQPNNGFREEIINLKTHFGDLTPEMEIFLKLSLSPESMSISQKTLRRGEQGYLYGQISSLNSYLLSPLGIFLDAWRKIGCKHLHNLNEDDVVQLMRSAVKPEISGRQMFKGVRSYHGMRIVFNTYCNIRHAYKLGLMDDGFSVELHEDYVLEKMIKEEAPKLTENFDYIAWRTGAKLDSVPVYVAMALLKASLEFLRSPRTKMAIATIRILDRGVSTSANLIKRVNDGRLSSFYVGTNNETAKENRKIIEEELCRVFNAGSITEIPPDILNANFPCKFKGSVGEIIARIHAISELTMIVIAILTGARRNELESIQWNDIYRDEHGDWRFRSEIAKTNQGIVTIRYISGLAAEAVDVLRLAGELKDYSDDSALFRRIKAEGLGGNSAARSAVALTLPNTFEHFINPYLDEELKINSFTIHALRHTWAEFALRRFDGDSVPELIRQHFRHSWGSYMTRHYIHGKVFEEDGKDLKKQYIAELIGRAANGETRIYGPVGEFIRDQLSHYEFVGEDEVAEITELFNGEIEPHSYGFCLVRPETVSVAKCYDKKTQMANTDEACWQKCGACANRATLASQREEIQVLALSMSQGIKSARTMGAKRLENVYVKALERAESTIREIDEGESKDA